MVSDPEPALIPDVGKSPTVGLAPQKRCSFLVFFIARNKYRSYWLMKEGSKYKSYWLMNESDGGAIICY
jgi:hypothetical protein